MLQLPVLQNRTNQPPNCFGSALWDPKSSECAGGADSTYTHPRTGSHVRERCNFFQACGARVQTRAAQPQTPIIPLSSYSFPAVVQPAQVRPTVSSSASRQQIPTMSQPMYPGQMTPQQMTHGHGQWHPAPTYQFNHGIPNYLSVPEPMVRGDSIWMVLLRELARGLIKSFGHTLSYFIDTRPLQKADKEE